MIIDSHTHVVSKDLETYPLADMQLPKVPTWRTEVAVPVEGLLDLMDGAGVDRVVLVHAMSAHGFDNRYVIDSARAHPDRSVGVGVIDIERFGPEEVRRLIEEEGLGGLRLFDMGFGTVRSDRTIPIARAAAAAGAPILISVRAGADAVPDVGALAAVVPDVRLIVDHCALPDLSSGAPWTGAASLFELVERENVAMKATPYLFEHVTTEVAAAFLSELVARFGAERVMWGSDFPHSHQLPYAGLWDFAREISAPLSAAGQELFLGGTAASLWPVLGQ